MQAVQHTYAYAGESEILSESGKQKLKLATSGGVTDQSESSAHPYFFQGALVEPRITALGLTVLAKVVAAKFTMNQDQRLAMRDPVVTSGGGLLRFEGFSGCCGVYGRLDLNPDSYDGLVTAHGTTNVDFNAEMRGALSRIRDRESVSLAVGDEEVILIRGSDQVVERKVKLPTRWLKGFVEVQAFQARMKPRFALDRTSAVRLIQSIPKGIKSSTKVWLAAAGRTVRITRSPSRGSVQICGLERLRLVEELAPAMKGLKIYAEEDGETSCWEFNLGSQLFTFVLSPENYRGFSGEGQVLNDLVNPRTEALLDQARESLKWQAELRPEEYGANWDADPADILSVLGLLGTRGLVGYDLSRTAYFHREMPFDMSLVDSLHPRFKGARKLIDENKVKIVERKADGILAEVAGTDVMHRVQLSDHQQRCTCQWFTKYLGNRGPCKHILATQLVA